VVRIHLPSSGESVMWSLQSPSGSGDDLPLLNALNSAILASKSLKSGGCQ
jgi:hypothetical protein